MTAISGKARENITEKLNKIQRYDGLKAIACLLLGYRAGKSNWRGIPLSGLVLVMASGTPDMLLRFSIIAGGMFSCGVLAVADSRYIPYFLSYIIFTVCCNLLKKQRLSLISALTVLSVGKIFITWFAYPMYYKLLALLESVALYFLVRVVTAGADSFAGGLSTFTDCVSGFVALAVPVLALAGLDSHSLYPGLSFALAVGWYSIAGGNMPVALVGLLAASLSVLDKQNFTYLFMALCLLWLLGGYSGEKLSPLIYPTTVITAFVTNIILVSQLGGFALTGSVIFALIIYRAMPHFISPVSQRKADSFTQGRDWRLLMSSLKKLENSLNFLAGCVVDISRLNDKNNPATSLEDMVAEDVCRNCDRNSYCWQEKYSFTRGQFAEYSKKMHWSGEKNFGPGFVHQCCNIPRLTASFEENSRLQLSRRYILQSQKNNQKLLQNAFMSISAAVSDLIYQNQHSHLVNTTITMETDRFLKELSVGHTYCLCSQNPDRVTFAVHDPVDDSTLYKIQLHLEKLYGVRFSQPLAEQQGVELLYIFSARPLLTYDIRVEATPLKAVNGDNYTHFVHNGNLYVLLSDGMGTGSIAAAESRTVIAMARSLITTGVSMKNVVNMVNLALNLKGSGETSASLDILQTDLFTGKTTITKAGAGVSVVLDRQGITRHYRDSLPLGILKDVRPVECSFTLKSGDTAVIMSDGANIVSNGIKDMYSSTCRQIAAYICGENTTRDDKTVIAVRLKIAL